MVGAAGDDDSARERAKHSIQLEPIERQRARATARERGIETASVDRSLSHSIDHTNGNNAATMQGPRSTRWSVSLCVCSLSGVLSLALSLSGSRSSSSDEATKQQQQRQQQQQEESMIKNNRQLMLELHRWSIEFNV